MHHFILQLDKDSDFDNYLNVADGFFCDIIDFFVEKKVLKYLFLSKPKLLNMLYSKLTTVQTNNFVFLIVSEGPEKEFDFSDF